MAMTRAEARYHDSMTAQTPIGIPPDLVEALRAADRVVVLTGAGVSAESGVPTFRDAQTGLWARYNPQELATPQAFSRDPELVWRWYLWRRELVSKAEPNPGHLALVELEDRAPGFTLVTQNVDGLHQRAGSLSVIELHGNIVRTRCSGCGTLTDEPVDVEDGLPHCDSCGGLLRPDVVWFGESLPVGALQEAVEVCRSCDVCLSVGTSSVVQPAASLPYEALTGGAVLVEVNPEATPLTPRMTHALHGPSGRVLPALLRAAWPE